MNEGRSSWFLLLTPFLPLLALIPGGSWALPLAAPLTLWPAFRDRVREGDYFRAWTLGIAWAFLLSLGVIVLVLWMPAAARTGILHGEPYRQEMFGWIATGTGKENDPRRPSFRSTSFTSEPSSSSPGRAAAISVSFWEPGWWPT